MAIHIGTSGWSYDHWDGVLYPPGLPARDRLAVYASTFATVELNASFYRWPSDRTFAGWRRRLPDGFVMSVKAPAWSDPRQTAVRPRDVGRADRRRLARARRPSRRAAGAAGPDPHP